MKNIDFEMPFGAKDSELIGATYTIPEGFQAVIEGDKVIIKKDESAKFVAGLDVEEIKKELDKYIRICKPSGDFGWGTLYNTACHFAMWEKQQLLKDAIDSHVVVSIYTGSTHVPVHLPHDGSYKDNEKVKVIIVREGKK